jgi:two-component system sensor histidine kinase DegS
LEIDEMHLPGKIEQHVYRIIQECSRNAIHHGHAKNISISLKHDSGIRLLIEDDGTGFDRLKTKPQGIDSGFGMVSLKERVHLLNGSLDIVPRYPHGTRIVVIIPNV